MTPPKKEIVVALAGNPNSGKTTIFNNLTGANQHVGNFPGVLSGKKKANRIMTVIGLNLSIFPAPIRFPPIQYTKLIPRII